MCVCVPGVRVKGKDRWAAYGKLTQMYSLSVNQKDGEKGAAGKDGTCLVERQSDFP